VRAKWSKPKAEKTENGTRIDKGDSTQPLYKMGLLIKDTAVISGSAFKDY